MHDNIKSSKFTKKPHLHELISIFFSSLFKLNKIESTGACTCTCQAIQFSLVYKPHYYGGQTLEELTPLSMAEQLVSVARILAEILWHCLAAVLENHLLYTLTKTDFKGIALPVVRFRPFYHAFVAVRQLHLGFPLTFCLA